MDYVKLGRTGLDVSRLCLGCMSFRRAGSWQSLLTPDKEVSRALIHQAVEARINFFDTANSYSTGAHCGSTSDCGPSHASDAARQAVGQVAPFADTHRAIRGMFRLPLNRRCAVRLPAAIVDRGLQLPLCFQPDSPRSRRGLFWACSELHWGLTRHLGWNQPDQVESTIRFNLSTSGRRTSYGVLRRWLANPRRDDSLIALADFPGFRRCLSDAECVKRPESHMPRAARNATLRSGCGRCNPHTQYTPPPPSFTATPRRGYLTK
jgi:hypothetical protein